MNIIGVIGTCEFFSHQYKVGVISFEIGVIL